MFFMPLRKGRFGRRAVRRAHNLSGFNPRSRRLHVEQLEDRRLLSIDLSIDDVAVPEGDQTPRFIDAFVTSESGGLNYATGAIFGPDGNGDGAEDLYVASAFTDQVLRYDGVSGAFLDAFVSAASGGLDFPNGMVFGRDGHLYVGSRETDEVLRYDGSSDASLGAFVTTGSGGLTTSTNLVFGRDYSGDGKEDLYVGTGTILEPPYPNDPLFADQWALENTGQTGGTWDADIDAPAAWSVSTGNAATVVAVLDTGIDYTHEDLYLNIWLNQDEIPASLASSLTDTDGDALITFRDLNDVANASYVSDLNGTGYIDAGDLLADPTWADLIDADANGYTDDLLGWDWVNNDNDPMDENSHGTAVAGLLGATGDNGVGITGVSWNVQMMPLRFKFDNTTWTVDAAVSAIDYAVDQEAPISNNSWGNGTGEYIPEIYDAIDRARLSGHIFVAAAGNESRDADSLPRYPACYDLDNIISVGGVNQEDDLTSFSNWGATSVDLGAPSHNVMTTVLGNQYAPGSGTSSATPHVAGVAALLHSLHPDWEATQIKDRILSTVDPLPSLVDITVTGGRLNAAATVADTTISTGGAATIEGNSGTSQLVFTVTRAGDTSGEVTVDWSTSDDTAAASTDYVSAYGQLTFTPSGANQQTIIVDVNGDILTEPHETMRLDLQVTAGVATLSDGSALGTILNDDTSITIDDATVTEGDESISFIDAFVSAGSGGLSLPRGVVSGTDGNVYISSTADHNVLRYDGTSGAFLNAFTAPRDDVLRDPQGLAFHNGSLFVGGWTSDNVVRYDGVTGELLGEFVPTGSGGLDNAVGLVFGPDGNLYVASWNTDQVLRYDGTTGAPMGAFVTAVSGGLDQPAYIAFGPDDNLYVGSNAADCVLRYDGTTGVYIDKFVATGSGGLDGPRELVFRPDGYLYVASAFSDEVLRYDTTTGAFIDAVIPAGSGGLNYPIALVFDSDGNLLVGSRDSDELLRYGPASQAAFTLSLPSPSALPVAVEFSTADGTALAGSDYEAASGTLTFAPGETSKTIIVPTVNDLVTEDDETFVVNLSNPTGGATLADGQGVATIIDVEAPLFSDSFENGEWDGLWVEDSQNDWFRSTQRATNGSYSSEVDGRTTDATLTIANPVNLTPYGSAELTFDWLIESGLDAGEYLALDLFDGSSWNEAARLSGNVDPENTWHSETVAINGGYLTDNFQFRFRAKMSKSDEAANVDNVQLVATSLAGPPNQQPVAVDDTATTGEDVAVVINVLTNDSDPDPGDVIQVESVGQGTDGSVVDNGDGTVTYTPNPDANGADTFTYTISDGRGGTDSATVTVTINPIADAPDAVDDADSTTVETEVVIDVLQNDSDPDGDVISIVSVGDPPDGTTVDNGDGTVTYTPDPGFSGLDSFTYTITDGDLGTDDVTATVTVDVQAIPSELEFSSSGDPMVIGDLKTVSSPIVVTGTGVTVGDLSVWINLTHASPSDLTAQLISSTGSTLLITGPILSGDYVHEYVISGASGLPSTEPGRFRCPTASRTASVAR